MKKITLVFALMIALAGCAAEGHLNTPSGRPEITVNANLNDAQQESLHWLLANGYTVGSQQDTRLVLAGHQLLNSGAINVWITFNYYQKDNMTTTIYATKDFYYRYRSGAYPQYSQADYEELQQDLTTIAQNLSASK
jgi:hypothetical protein